MEKRDDWTAIVVMKTHLYGITQQEIADELGVTRAYVSMVLDCRRRPMRSNIKERLEAAVETIIRKKTGVESGIDEQEQT